MAEPAQRRTGFASTITVGVAAATLCAVAAAKPWFHLAADAPTGVVLPD
jgi:hypothetical protein